MLVLVNRRSVDADKPWWSYEGMVLVDVAHILASSGVLQVNDDGITMNN